MAERKIKALYMGERFARCLEQHRQARVFSVHRKVINLSVEDELLALALPQAGGSSRFLCLSALPDVKPGDLFLLNLREMKIDLSEVPLWRGPLPSDTRAQITSELLADFVTNGTCLCHLFPRVVTPQNVQHYIGLGPGLTPAGDDVLLGYIAADNHLGGDPAHTKAMHEAVLANLGRTTRLSAQLLNNAIARDYHESIQRVLAILCGISSENLLTALRRLAQMGATSGQSIIYGMQLALERR